MKDVSKVVPALVIATALLVGCANVGWCSEGNDVSARPVDATILFDGKDFSQWVGEDGNSVKWRIVDGVMQVVPGTSSIVTKQDFQDFRLHVEFNIPDSPPGTEGQGKGNSGVYIQRRYEVQILDSFGQQPMTDGCGSLYKTKAPDRNVCKKPGEWQSFDIFFRAARWQDGKKIENVRITVLHNGQVIHNNVDIPNKTGAGQPEGPQPGPIKLQEHGSTVKFRNLWIVAME
jgi:hypothetical protein